jgi:hypothetical protein
MNYQAVLVVVLVAQRQSSKPLVRVPKVHQECNPYFRINGDPKI